MPFLGRSWGGTCGPCAPWPDRFSNQEVAQALRGLSPQWTFAAIRLSFPEHPGQASSPHTGAGERGALGGAQPWLSRARVCTVVFSSSQLQSARSSQPLTAEWGALGRAVEERPGEASHPTPLPNLQRGQKECEGLGIGREQASQWQGTGRAEQCKTGPCCPCASEGTSRLLALGLMWSLASPRLLSLPLRPSCPLGTPKDFVPGRANARPALTFPSHPQDEPYIVAPLH